jgi:hypothetical protein
MRGKANLKKWVWCGLVLLLTICTAKADKIIYVDDDTVGANNGSSWADAYNYLQDALDVAHEGDEIRVAQGIYRPDLGGDNTPGDRRATFQLKSGVNIKGGYAGMGEADPNAVNMNLYKSFLNGDLNCDDVGRGLPERIYFDNQLKRDNSCRIVYGSNVDETAILNGFIIIGGFCISISNDCNDEPKGGAAIRIEYGSPKILNCLITNNYCVGGGIVLNNDSNPTFIGCIFSENSGSSMENIASSPEITNCTFEFSTRGMENHNGSSPALTNCVFRDNSWYGMENHTGSSPTLTNCKFEQNQRGLNNNSDCNAVLVDCKFKNNEDYGLSSGSNTNLIITNCTFENNGDGGIGSGPTCNLVLNNCLFSGNGSSRSFGGYGSGLSSLQSDLVLYNCKFIGNVAKYDGGGIKSIASSLRLYNCIFSDNSAESGGAMDISSDSILTLYNCIINNNSADEGGSGIGISSGKAMLYNCTLSGNTTRWWRGGEGGGIYNSANRSEIILTNCILWGNTPVQIEGEAIVSYSNIQGGLPGEGNIDVDPLFADPDNGDYHLKSQAGRWEPNDGRWTMDDVTSPCIDAGDPRSDYSAEPQPNGQRINIGAYGGTPEASLSLAVN